MSRRARVVSQAASGHYQIIWEVEREECRKVPDDKLKISETLSIYRDPVTVVDHICQGIRVAGLSILEATRSQSLREITNEESRVLYVHDSGFPTGKYTN